MKKRKRIAASAEEPEPEETEEEEVNGDTVRMRALEGIGNVGLSHAGKVYKIEPDDEGLVDAPAECVSELRKLGFTPYAAPSRKAVRDSR